MAQANDRRWPDAVAVSVVWLAVIAGLAAASYAGLGEDSRPLVIRLAASAAVAIVLMQIHRSVRRTIGAEPASRLDLARQPPPREAKIPPQFSKLQTQLQLGLASRDCFDRVLWPRLTALAKHRSTTLAPPPKRPLSRRGPRLREVAYLISLIEREP